MVGMRWLVGLGALCALGVLGGCGGGGGEADAALPDAPLDAAPACASDDDCEDGLACNGLATCSEGRCVAGAPLRCDDGVVCTTDFCSEELRRCVNRPVDADGDGIAASGCLDARGVPLGADCDDASASVYPGAAELCDALGVDEDCDPSTRGGRDGDGDGFEDAACCNGSGPGACGTDCNDAVRGANPDATEVCNGLDDDCDGRIDEGVLVTVYRDADGDGRGATSMPSMACATTSGYAAEGGDCDDASVLRSPALPEVCDGIDNDCDGTADPADAPVVATWYRDEDGDGFGDPGRSERSCARPMGSYSLLGTDCDDTTPSRHPAQAERCNGVDDDCNGVADFAIAPGDLEDDDRDGRPDARCSPAPDPSVADCDDRDAASSAGAAEVCDGRDNDCDGGVDEGVSVTPLFRDADGDGWGSESSGVILGCGAVDGYVARAGDCDDARAARAPGSEEGCNGADDDCDRAIDEGADVDLCAELPGYRCAAGLCRPPSGGCASGTGDCDGLAINGCETNLSSDPEHCGSCTTPCPAYPHVVRRTCVGGSTCGFDRGADCEPGWVDCDGAAGNGCEAQLGTDLHCFDCSDACSSMETCNPTTRMCVPDMGTCMAPLDDCDMNGTCETNTSTSPSHCGGCARPCTGGNAIWTCAAGTCQVSGCLGGWQNCDGSHVNGCEVPPNDALHCGSCMRSCIEPFTTAPCLGGVCGMPTCTPGRYDCDDDLGTGGNGCELETPCPSVTWARTWGDSDDDSPAFGGEMMDVVVDAAGNAYVLSSFTGAITVGGTVYTAAPGGGLVIALDPSGAVRWVTVLNADVMADVIPERIQLLGAGAGVVVVGTAYGVGNVEASGDFVGSLGSSTTPFVLRLGTSDGRLVWGRTIPASDGAEARALDVTAGGAVVVGGPFVGDVNFGAGFLRTGSDDSYVAYLDGTTGSTTSIATLGGAGNQVITGLDVRDMDGDLFLGGIFSGSGWSPPAPASPLTYAGGIDGFALRCTGSLGACNYALAIGTAGNEAVIDVHAGDGGEWVISGSYQGSVTIGFGTLSGAAEGGFMAGISYMGAGSISWATGHTGAGTTVQGIRRFRFGPMNRIHTAFTITNTVGIGLFAGRSLPVGPVPQPYVAVLESSSGGVYAFQPLTTSAEVRAQSLAVRGDGRNVVVGAFAGSTPLGGASLTTAGSWDQVAFLTPVLTP